jgi:hypothetical protein
MLDMPSQAIWMALQEKNMIMKKVLVSALFAAGTIAAVATPTASMAQVEFNLTFGPPAAIYEPIPEARRGYVWQAGHWNWNGNRHVWNAGSWQASRPGYSYNAPRWVENNGRWSYQASRWDRDGDGIPNNRDATPNGRNQNWDRDGDGIRNSRDATPDGVHRRSDRDHDGVSDNRDRYPNNPNYR